VIALIGSNSQLGKCFSEQTKFNIFKLDSHDLNLKHIDEIKESLNTKKFDVVINFSAFNDVEDAEKNEDAFLVNHLAVKKIAELCKRDNAFFIHISTDYVFDGSAQFYDEKCTPNPINKYGLSKLLGEEAIRNYCTEYIILRTSWLYSHHISPNNFLHNIKKNFDLNSNTMYGSIDSFGSPTSASNLADGVETILNYFFDSSLKFGTYHFADIGNISRFKFLEKILADLSKLNPEKKKILEKVENSFFNLVAPRPLNTSLNCDLFSKEFHYQFENWDNALSKVVKKL